MGDPVIYLQRSGIIASGAAGAASGGGGATIPTDYIAFYTMDSISGGTLSDETGTYDGTLVGNAQQDTSVFKTGSASLLLDGTGDYVSLGDVLDFGGNADPSFSVAFWINADTVSDTRGRGIISKDDAVFGTRLWSAQHHGANSQIRFGIYDGSYVSRDCASAVTLNTWEHYACVYDATAQTLNIYRDGSVDNGSLNNGPVPSSFNSGSEGTFIGRCIEHDWSNDFDGNIDSLIVYDRALSASEVSDIYTSS